MISSKSVDYGKLVGGHKAVILGESHHATRAYQDEITTSLKQFRRLGFTHFGLEMLQTDVNVNSDKAVAKQIDEAFYPGHVQVYQEAKRSNFTIVPLDMPISQQQAYATKSLDKRYGDRNHWMVKAAMKYLSAGHKMVLFMHHGHAMGKTGNLQVPDKDGVRSLLKAKGISTTYIQIAGGTWSENTCSPRSSAVSNRAQLKSMQNTLFISSGEVGIDHVVHLPQDCSVR